MRIMPKTVTVPPATVTETVSAAAGAVVGVVGAFLGGWLISPLVGVPTINQNALSAGALLVSLVGAIILLAIVNLVRRGKAR